MGEFKRQKAGQTLSTLPHNQTPLLIRAMAYIWWKVGYYISSSGPFLSLVFPPHSPLSQPNPSIHCFPTCSVKSKTQIPTSLHRNHTLILITRFKPCPWSNSTSTTMELLLEPLSWFLPSIRPGLYGIKPSTPSGEWWFTCPSNSWDPGLAIKDSI